MGLILQQELGSLDARVLVRLAGGYVTDLLHNRVIWHRTRRGGDPPVTHDGGRWNGTDGACAPGNCHLAAVVASAGRR